MFNTDVLWVFIFQYFRLVVLICPKFYSNRSQFLFFDFNIPHVYQTKETLPVRTKILNVRVSLIKLIFRLANYMWIENSNGWAMVQQNRTMLFFVTINFSSDSVLYYQYFRKTAVLLLTGPWGVRIWNIFIFRNVLDTHALWNTNEFFCNSTFAKSWPALICNGLQPLNVNAGGILPGVGRK